MLFLLQENYHFIPSFLHQVTMRWFLKCIFLLFSIFAQKTTSEKYLTSLNHKENAPLALVRQKTAEGGLEFAEPHDYYEHNRNYIDFIYEDDTQEFFIACPAHLPDQITRQESLNAENKQSFDFKQHFVDDILFFKELNPAKDTICEKEMRPAIKKIDEVNDCYVTKDQRRGDTYAVGYMVEDPLNKKIDFVTSYRFCHVKEKGTMHTIHSIKPSNLLNYKATRKVEKWFTSYIDTLNKKSVQWLKDENIKKYQLVTYYDMPVHSSQITTLFPFNFIPIKDGHVKIHLNTVDQYIRSFAKFNKLELTVYSGKLVREREYVKPRPLCFSPKCTKVIKEYIWKVIIDSNKRAVVVITHLPPITSYCSILCEKHITADETENGCTYTCPLENALLTLFGLENIEWGMVLPFNLPEVKKQGERNPLADDNGESGNGEVNISSFINANDGFASAIVAYEAGNAIQSLAEAEAADNDGNGHGTDDGGPGGPGEG